MSFQTLGLGRRAGKSTEIIERYKKNPGYIVCHLGSREMFIHEGVEKKHLMGYDSFLRGGCRGYQGPIYIDGIDHMIRNVGGPFNPVFATYTGTDYRQEWEKLNSPVYRALIGKR